MHIGLGLWPSVSYARPSALTVAQQLGLTPAFMLDAGASASYPGTGQTWFDLTANDRDFYLGADGSASTDDPTPNGTAGQLSAGEYFGFDGSDKFTAISNGTFINSLHKDNSTTTLILLARFPNFSANAVMFGTARLTSDIGIRHMIGTSGQLSIGVNNGGGTFQGLIISSITATAGRDTFIAISVDEAGGAGASHVRIDDQVETFDGEITSPSASAASHNLTIGGNNITTQGFVNGTRVWIAGGFASALTPAQTGALYASLIGRAA